LRVPAVFTLATVVVVGAIISLATNNWLILVIAIALHLIVSTLVLGFVFKATNQGDKPDPVTEAHIEAGDKPKKADGLTDTSRREDREVVL
jgi:hypothetical protein